MRLVTRRDPLARELDTWRNALENLLNEVPESAYQTDRPWTLALDVAEKEDGFVVKASVPGINPDDLEITFSDNILTIKGEMKEDKDVEEGKYHLRERRYGLFQRSIALPVPIDADKIEATYNDGVLTLNIPKVEEVKPKRINVKAS